MRYWGAPITFQAVRRWLRGDSIPSQDKLQVLAGWLGVEPQFLRYGQQSSQDRGEMQATWVIPVGGEEDEVLRIYRGLTEEQRKILRQVVLTFARANGLQPEDTEGSS
ncbi:helix-turn-helix transcriptional regulator [Salinicola sp. CPA57]|uniref:helix-turn-helix domain-containing protein n=1 Tax=Salinicola sp. CPA57 TaxID=1949080 RepID=UPI001E534F70|nr:helix-turn-helix transcriptional regulator [Salinicola sp. CPA57]